MSWSDTDVFILSSPFYIDMDRYTAWSGRILEWLKAKGVKIDVKTAATETMAVAPPITPALDTRELYVISSVTACLDIAGAARTVRIVSLTFSERNGVELLLSSLPDTLVWVPILDCVSAPRMINSFFSRLEDKYQELGIAHIEPSKARTVAHDYDLSLLDEGDITDHNCNDEHGIRFLCNDCTGVVWVPLVCMQKQTNSVKRTVAVCICTYFTNLVQGLYPFGKIWPSQCGA